MYKCPHCGGEMEFLPESGIIKCEYCGSEFTPEESSGDEIRKTRKKAEEHAMAEGKVYTCSQCGANIYTTEETGVTFCSYCGSQAFLESRMMGDENIAPDVIIPFRISKEKCEELYREKIKKAWFLPSSMKKDTEIEKFRGIYMPCWVYSGEAEAEGEYTGVVTRRSGSYDIIRTYKVNAVGKGIYDGYVRDASSSFPDGIMDEIAPFPTSKAVPFDDAYMTGFYADIGNIPSDLYTEDIYQILDNNIKNGIRKDKRVSDKNVSASEISRNTDVTGRITQVRKGFLPVWFLSNKHERTGMMSYAVVNGLTGKIHADLPVDMKKYLLLSAGISAAAFVVLFILQEIFARAFSFTPKLIMIITMILLGILTIISTKMIRDTYIQEHGLDDVGLMYLKKRSKDGDVPPARDPAEGDPALNEQGFVHSGSNDGTPSSVSAGTKGMLKGVGIVFLGIFSFFILPGIIYGIGEALDMKFGALGIIIGVVLFIVVLCVGNKGKTSGKDIPLSERKQKLPFHVVLRAMALPLIGILGALVILIMSPAHDIYYYGAVLLCCIMLILTLLDFVRSTSRLALRKPAQLGKRGGDENA